jgi:hypothetical protein
MSDLTLAAISIRRRTAAIAVFRKTHLDDVLIRELATNQQKAENSIAGFVRQFLAQHQIELVAIENRPEQSSRIQQLYEIATTVLRTESVPIQVVPEEDLFQSFAIPPVQYRSQLRKIAQSIWPQLDNREFGRAPIDAAALGLFVQTERLFILNSPQS